MTYETPIFQTESASGNYAPVNESSTFYSIGEQKEDFRALADSQYKPENRRVIQDFYRSPDVRAAIADQEAKSRPNQKTGLVKRVLALL